MLKKVVEIKQKLSFILTKEQKRLFMIVLFAAFISALFEMLGVSVIVPLVNVMLTPEKLFEYKWLSPFIQLFSIRTNKQMIIMVIIGTIVLYLLKACYMVGFSYIKAKYASKVQRECSVYMMKSYMSRGYSYFLKKNTNEITQGVVEDVQGLYNIINCLIYTVTKSLIVALIGLWMFISDWQTAAALIMTSVFCLFIILICFKKPVRLVGIKVRDYTIEANKTLFQSIQGIKEVIVMRKQHEFADQYEYFMHKRQKEDIKRTVYTDAPNNIVEAFCITAIMIVLCLKILYTSDVTAFIAILASFAVGAFRIMPAIGYISSSINTIIANLAHMDNVYENYRQAKLCEKESCNIEVKDNPQYANLNFNDQISIEHVTFCYAEELGNVIEDLSLSIEKNKSVAFIGESGAGKSTLADIILGILSVSSGEIKVDGVNIKEIPNRWGKLISFVPQSIYLFDASIAENVAFGVPKDKIDVARVKKALEMADVLTFIESLPETIWERVGDHGVRLSGGQRQRIGIARALYYEPQILVLDEATSALDTDTEKNVIEAIESLKGNITMIVIAHRLTTIKNCDNIYEIKNGKAYERRYEDLV